MSPVYYPQTSSPIPFIDLKGDNNQQQNSFQVFGYLHGDHFSTTTTNNSSFSYNPDNLLKSEEMFSLDYTRHDQMKVENMVLSDEKAREVGEACSSWIQSRVGDESGSKNSNTYSENQKNQSRKWKSSKVRIMQKMMVNSRESRKEEVYDEDVVKRQTNDGIRVCTDCHTTTTPLWRSGPHGPKSLCNACGIRQRKARRAAMAAAAAAAATGFGIDAMSHVEGPKQKVEGIKAEKGLDHDKNHTLPLKKRSKIIEATHNNSKKLGVEDLALSSNKDYLKDNSMRSFPRDEEEGAFLLMALSCGLACSSY